MLALQYIGDVESSAMFGLIVSVDRSETVGKKLSGKSSWYIFSRSSQAGGLGWSRF